MKIKICYVAFLLLVLSVLCVTPVLASDGDECPHHEATVTSLRACVIHAVEMGHIDNSGVANSLLAKLDAAQATVDRGQNGVAVAQLQAFMHEVEAQAGHHIDTQHATHMIMHANEVINRLSQ